MAKHRQAAQPRPIDPASAPMPEPGPSAREFAELRQQLLALTGKYNELKQATGGVTLLAPEEVPVYEIGPGGYYSPDDVLYPPGVQIEDITGSIIPNEDMIPLNDAAERRMAAYLASLPRTGSGPVKAELWIEATAAVLPTFNGAGMSPVERDAELHRLVLAQVQRIRAHEMGLTDAPMRLPVRAPRSGPVPLMSNSRIRGPQYTRQRAPALAAAQKAAPHMGTVQNQTIGR